MLAKKYRLPLSEEPFQGTITVGKTCKLISKPNSLSNSRLSVIVTKKVAPKAVMRNQYKRRVRHTLQSLLDHQPYLDMLVIANPGINQSERAQLRQELLTLHSRAQQNLKQK